MTSEEARKEQLRQLEAATKSGNACFMTEIATPGCRPDSVKETEIEKQNR